MHNAKAADIDVEKAPLLNTHSVKSAEASKKQTVYFLTLASCAILSSIGYGYLQQSVFETKDFKYGGWVTFLTYVTCATCGWLEGAITGKLTRHAAVKDFLLVSLLAMGGNYFTNWALQYLNYITRIVAKSCKVLPVMAVGTLILGKQYTKSHYMAGFVLVTGIALFTSGDADGSVNFSIVGIFLIILGVVCDALTGNLEERLFFRIKVPCTHAEVMLYMSAFAAIESFIVIFFTGELGRAMEYSTQYTDIVPAICASSVLNYIAVSLVLHIIKSFGATNAEIVKSLKKVFQVVISFVAYPKPLSWKYVVGGLLVSLALWWLQRTKEKPQSEAQERKTLPTRTSTPPPSISDWLAGSQQLANARR